MQKPDIASDALRIKRREMDDRSVMGRLSRYLFSRDMAAVVGVGIGTLSMLSPWLLVSGYPGARVIPPAGVRLWPSVLNWGSHSFFDLIWADSPFRVPLLVFLVGTFIAAFTRIGGLVQGAGLIGFALSAEPGYISAPPPLPSISPELYHSNFYIFMIGYLLAIVSTLVVMFGGRKFAWNSRNYGNVPANGRMTAFLQNATRIIR